jgi:hypothetical protein
MTDRERERNLGNALEAIRIKLNAPRDYSHPAAIAALFDQVEEIATLALAQNVWAPK